MSPAEFERFGQEREQEARRRGAMLPESRRLGIVALDGEACVGCAVVDVHPHGDDRGGWAFLAELFVEKPYRKHGLGRALLLAVERRAVSEGVHAIWTRTAEYEAPGFYRHMGYGTTHTLPNWYRSGHGNVVLRKPLVAQPPVEPSLGSTVELHERMPTSAELVRTAEGFVEHGREFGNPREESERIGFVAMQGDGPIGYVSALVRRIGDQLGHWCTLTDLFVTVPARHVGTGSVLLDAMHAKLRTLGVGAVETWAPGFHQIDFMRTHGYDVCTEFEDWYPGGAALVALHATLARARGGDGSS